MSVAIKAEGLSKAYQLGEFSTGTLSQDIERMWYRLRGKEDPFLKIGESNDRTAKGNSNIVWSLKDINFEIKQGEAVGIIGRNGAGKSTLLKILSRVTTPTRGNVKVKGRIASLLEVGTGFHPELTGRENIFLNGAILGMRKEEIKRKFDEIVAFAGVERYIDTPVKRYSSGMYVRLAFAVAAHLESEILIVDEVLAVGDIEFQKKCLGKMDTLSTKEGRTVLFVSHQMGTIAQLCSKAILLKQGQMVIYDSSLKVMDKYLNTNEGLNGNKYETKKDRSNTDDHFLKEVYTVNEQNKETEEFGFSDSLSVCCNVNLKSGASRLQIGVTLQNINGVYISTSIYDLQKEDIQGRDSIKIAIAFPSHIIAPGSYYFRVALFDNDVVYEVLENICGIRIIDTGTHLSKYEGINYGSVVLNNKWQII
jgi:lipopolysaccharide transport system ATP-binding protein